MNVTIRHVLAAHRPCSLVMLARDGDALASASPGLLARATPAGQASVGRPLEGVLTPGAFS